LVKGAVEQFSHLAGDIKVFTEVKSRFQKVAVHNRLLFGDFLVIEIDPVSNAI
jgi:hypothetical protein